MFSCWRSIGWFARVDAAELRRPAGRGRLSAVGLCTPGAASRPPAWAPESLSAAWRGWWSCSCSWTERLLNTSVALLMVWLAGPRPASSSLLSPSCTLSIGEDRVLGRLVRIRCCGADGSGWRCSSIATDSFGMVTCSANRPDNAFMMVGHESRIVAGVAILLREPLVVPLFLVSWPACPAHRLRGAGYFVAGNADPGPAVAAAGILVTAFWLVVRQLTPALPGADGHVVAGGVRRSLPWCLALLLRVVRWRLLLLCCSVLGSWRRSVRRRGPWGGAMRSRDAFRLPDL